MHSREMSPQRAVYLPRHSVVVGVLRFSSLRQITAALALGIMLGLITLVASPLVALGGMIGLVLLVMAITNPEVVILVVLCFTSGVIPDRFNSYVSLPVGRAQVSDLLLLWLLFVVLFRVFTDRSFRYNKTPLDPPILLFFGAVLVGLANAVLRHGIGFSDATYDARMLMYYLIFFAITNLIQTRSQLIRLAHGIFAIGLLVAVMMILQSSLLSLIPPMVEWSPQYGGLVRIFHPGFPLVYVGLLTLVSNLALCNNGERSLSRWLLILVMGGALFVTVTRNVLVSAAMGFVLLIAILPRFERSRLVRNVLGIACLSIVFGSLLVLSRTESKVVDYVVAFRERLEGMLSADILEPGETLSYRWEEIQLARAQISRHPIFGIGLHNPYRPAFYPGEPQSLQRYIHNTYLSLWLKTGLVGLVSFLWFSIVFLWRGFGKWRNTQDDFLRSVLLGLAVAYVGMMLSNLVAPSMVEPGSLASFGMILGLGESIVLQTKKSEEWRERTMLS